ncbi:hypothetical protein P2G88_11685 [Aliiglaciecola sp. CAU 1673]|uniref:hypothetical protein n=1 Tax=Aliiglaciecola sp. CAU 1673 TaxID=3032595 RepID=UPI0023DB2EAD|nr:hypothetical protein [Aliiglaciecola sp. CAU 1673]MDF2178911.1 hypothetical protein [Aliiglaciecola sp. CAU 1673]
MFLRTTTALMLLAFTSYAAAGCDIAGTWKHADKAAWLNIDTLNSIITVEKHEVAPQAAGLTVIKDLAEDSTGHNLWSGRMYDAAKEDYIVVGLTSKDCKTLLVSDQGNEILRLLR